MNVILDTNIWISFLMGKRLHNVADIFERSDVQVYVSKDALGDEAYAGFKKSDIGDIYGVKGFVLFRIAART